MESKEHLSFKKKKLKGELCSQDITPGKARSGRMWQWRPEAPEAFLYLRNPDRTRSKQVGGGRSGGVLQGDSWLVFGAFFSVFLTPLLSDEVLCSHCRALLYYYCRVISRIP